MPRHRSMLVLLVATLSLTVSGWPSPGAPIGRVAAAVDATGPSVAFLAPANGATVSGSVAIAVQSTDPSGTSKVRFWAGSSYLGFDLIYPYSKTWNASGLQNGRYTLKTEALDSLNNSTTRTISVILVNPDSTPPSVAITSPGSGASVSGNVTISASASDSQGLSKVRFWAGSTYLGFDPSAPFSVIWNSAGTPDGSRVLKAQAVDWANNTADATASVNVVNADATPPSVAITAPGNGATVSGNVSISAIASDNNGVSKVRFWVGSAYLGFDTTAPFRMIWNSAAAPNGNRVLRAQAVDFANNTTDAAVSVAVSNCVPPALCGPQLGGCPVLPADNPWNTDISSAPLHANSAAYIASFNQSGNGFLHADFGGGGEYGIPYLIVPESQPGVPVDFVDYGDESDPGPYPIPLNAPIEGGSDRHTLALQQGTCKLFELFNAHPTAGGWEASSGAIFDLRSNALRPEGWTSADAAGLPILPGLARYDEVQSGAISHALRVTVGQTQRGYIHPATHWASSSSNPNLPPMGLRLRLRADFDTSGYTGDARVILEALKKYGLIVADNGTSWYITGAMDSRWDDDDLNQLKTVPGSAFEAVDTGPIITP